MKNFPEMILKMLFGPLTLLLLTLGIANLVKSAEPSANASSLLAITLTDEVIKNAQITLETAGSVQIKTAMTFQGQVKLNTGRAAQVVPRLSGVVTEVRKDLGDAVKKDEVIAVIESRELANAKSDYIEAVNRLEFARISFAREEALSKQKISAKEDYLASGRALQEAELGKHLTGQKLRALGLDAAALSKLVVAPKGGKKWFIVSGQSLTRYEVRAAVDGLVIEKNVMLGQAVDEQTKLFVLADMSAVWVDAKVLAKDLNLLKVGQKTKVTSKNARLIGLGEVIYIGSRFDEKTQMGMVRVLLQNPEGKWRPGLFVSVNLLQENVSPPVAVSMEAIQVIGDRNALFVQIGKNFEVRPVKLGISDGRMVEILEGLSGGEQVVTQNSFAIKAEWLNRGGELK